MPETLQLGFKETSDELMAGRSCTFLPLPLLVEMLWFSAPLVHVLTGAGLLNTVFEQPVLCPCPVQPVPLPGRSPVQPVSFPAWACSASPPAWALCSASLPCLGACSARSSAWAPCSASPRLGASVQPVPLPGRPVPSWSSALAALSAAGPCLAGLWLDLTMYAWFIPNAVETQSLVPLAPWHDDAFQMKHGK